ncbi:hypothetical protein Pen01_49800 [Phytomonospora endophytica]|nr:hypothetical protein Pen01_49800 [Phytomonospora endophytica]
MEGVRAAENTAVIELASAVHHARAARDRAERERARLGLNRDGAVELSEALDTVVDLAEGLTRAIVHDWRHVTHNSGLIRAFRAFTSAEDTLDAALYGGADTPVRPRHGAPLADVIAGAAEHARTAAAIVSRRRYRWHDPRGLALHLDATGSRLTAIVARRLPSVAGRRVGLGPASAVEACAIAHSLVHAAHPEPGGETGSALARFDALHRLLWRDLVAAGIEAPDARPGGVPGQCDGLSHPELGVSGAVMALLARVGHDPVAARLLA